MPNYWYGAVNNEGDRTTSVSVTGTEEVVATLNKLMAEFPDDVKKDLAQYAEAILQASLDECPWESTHLKQTGTWEYAKDGTVMLKTWDPATMTLSLLKPCRSQMLKKAILLSDTIHPMQNISMRC